MAAALVGSQEVFRVRDETLPTLNPLTVQALASRACGPAVASEAALHEVLVQRVLPTRPLASQPYLCVTVPARCLSWETLSTDRLCLESRRWQSLC